MKSAPTLFIASAIVLFGSMAAAEEASEFLLVCKGTHGDQGTIDGKFRQEGPFADEKRWIVDLSAITIRPESWKAPYNTKIDERSITGETTLGRNHLEIFISRIDGAYKENNIYETDRSETFYTAQGYCDRQQIQQKF